MHDSLYLYPIAHEKLMFYWMLEAKEMKEWIRLDQTLSLTLFRWLKSNSKIAALLGSIWLALAIFLAVSSTTIVRLLLLFETKEKKHSARRCIRDKCT